MLNGAGRDITTSLRLWRHRLPLRMGWYIRQGSWGQQRLLVDGSKEIVMSATSEKRRGKILPISMLDEEAEDGDL